MPSWIKPVLITLAALALIPFAFVARSRVSKSEQPRVHIIPDMDNQGRYKSQQVNALFADGRAMRPPIAGTVSRGDLSIDPEVATGVSGEAWLETIPLPVTDALVERGRREYGIYCTPCHGMSGYGDGMIARRADRLQQGTWVPPSSFHAEPASTRPVGHIFNTITNGIRNMPAYGPQIGVEDRWAIVSYVRALQRSQRASIDDVPAEARSGLR